MQRNLLEDIPPQIPEELFEPLLAGKSFRVERIVSDGHASPPEFWYDQAEDEWVLILRGAAVLELETETGRTEKVTMRQGDCLLIPGHQRHRVVSTDANEKTIWLAIHFEQTQAT